MALTKTINIDGKEVTFRASAAIPRLYRVKFHRDIYKDLDALQKAMDEKLGNSCDSTPEEEAQLISNRNADWLAKLPAIMKERPTFFAVGAGHLPGEKGLLQLLRNAGYTVEGQK